MDRQSEEPIPAQQKTPFPWREPQKRRQVLPVGIQQGEKRGENVAFLQGGAPGGARWGEIRGLIARCEDLPEDVRVSLVAMGDKSQVGSVELSTQ